jgi:erythronate-4-phosphate dehydrogenase
MSPDSDSGGGLQQCKPETIIRIIVDDKIPYIKGALEPFAEMVYLAGHELTAAMAKEANALIIRTRTICNAQLLKGSAVKFIASATIGCDHIDVAYCKQQGITWTNAPGCNAESVKQYLASALFAYARKEQVKLRDLTIGIVGVGNVGRKVADLCRAIGMRVLLNDPPRQRAEGSGAFTDLVRIRQQADIITFHVPLQSAGEFATQHMVDNSFLKELGKSPLLVNTCRGEVFASSDVKSALDSGSISGLIIDCWENEPEIDLELLEKVDFATAHIAGYSRDGKAVGTMMSIRALSRFFKLGIDDWKPTAIELPERPQLQLDGHNKDDESVLAEAVLATYDISEDDKRLRAAPGSFERFRGEYPVRREFHNYRVEAKNVNKCSLLALKKMGFQLP